MQLIGFFSWIPLDKLSVRISREIDKDWKPSKIKLHRLNLSDIF